MKFISIVPNDPQEKFVYACRPFSDLALTVGVGSAIDPYPISGLAHLTEHIMLTGSKKYPLSNFLDKVVEKYNGKSNAETSSFSTTFYFQVEKQGFFEAIDILHSVFADPLLRKENLANEINNVRSELPMRRFKEENINYFTLRHLANTRDNTLFRDGYGELLEKDTPEARTALHTKLKEFVAKYYQPNLMTLVVSGHLTQDQISVNVTNPFAQLKNNHIDRPLALSKYAPFLSNTYSRLFLVRGNQDGHTFYMNFLLPSYFQYFKELPVEYISVLMTYFSRSSLKHRLMHLGLIEDMSDETVTSNYEYTIYSLKFELTDKGLLNTETISKAVFSYLDRIRRKGISEAFYEKLSSISMVNFIYEISSTKFPTKNRPSNMLELVKDMSVEMQNLPINSILTGKRIFKLFSAPLIEEVIDSMLPERTIFVIKSKNFTLSPNITEFSEANKSLSLLQQPPNSTVHLHTASFDGFNISASHAVNIKSQLANIYYTSTRIPLDSIRLMTAFNESLVDGVGMPLAVRGLPGSFAVVGHMCGKSVAGSRGGKGVGNVGSGDNGTGKGMAGVDAEEKCLLQEVKKDIWTHYPAEIKTNQSLRVYHKLFRYYLSPTTVIWLDFKNNEFNQILLQAAKGDPKARLQFEQFQLLQLLSKEYFEELISLEYFDYFLSDYEFGWVNSKTSSSLFIKGFSDKIEEFAVNLMTGLTNTTIDQNILERAKDKVKKKFHDNTFVSSLEEGLQMLNKAIDRLALDLTPSSTTRSRYQQFIESTTLDQMSQFIHKTLNTSSDTFVFFGNVMQETALNISSNLSRALHKGALPSPISPIYQNLTFELPSALGYGHQVYRSLVTNIDDTNSLYVSYCQLGFADQRTRVLAAMLQSLMNQVTFQYVRVKRNAGYVANAVLSQNENVKVNL